MISILPGVLLVAGAPIVDWLPLTCQSALHYFIRARVEARGSAVTVQGLTPDSLSHVLSVKVAFPPSSPLQFSSVRHSKGCFGFFLRFCYQNLRMVPEEPPVLLPFC